MVRPLKKEYLDMNNDKNIDSVMYYEFYGLSTDTKPLNATTSPPIVTGSLFVEVDSGKAYLFDEAGDQWYEVNRSDS